MQYCSTNCIHSAVLHHKTVFTLQYYTTNCIHSIVLHYKLYSLNSTTLQTIHSVVLYYKLYCVNSAVLQYRLFTQQYYSTDYTHSTLQTVFCKLCTTTVPTVFTLQYYSTNCIHPAALHYKLFCKLSHTTLQTVFCKPSVVLHCKLFYSVKLATLRYKLYSVCSAELHYKLFFILLVYYKLYCLPHSTGGRHTYSPPPKKKNCKLEIHISNLNIQSVHIGVPFQWPKYGSMCLTAEFSQSRSVFIDRKIEGCLTFRNVCQTIS